MSNSNKKARSQMANKIPNLCEWVELGILSYKICTRNFDCESCPLDRALRGYYDEHKATTAHVSHHYIAPISKFLLALKNKLMQQCDEQLFVHPDHLWIKPTTGDEVRIGIDEMTSSVLGTVDSVMLPEAGEHLNRGACCAEIVQKEHIFSIHAPVSGEITEINNELLDLPAQLTIAPQNQGWMLSIIPDNLDEDLSSCYSGDSLKSWYSTEVDWLEVLVMNNIRQMQSAIGPTLPDGGEPSRDFRDYFSKDQYRHIMSNLLGINKYQNRDNNYF